MSWQYWVAGYVLFCLMTLLLFYGASKCNRAYDRIDKEYDNEPML